MTGPGYQLRRHFAPGREWWDVTLDGVVVFQSASRQECCDELNKTADEQMYFRLIAHKPEGGMTQVGQYRTIRGAVKAMQEAECKSRIMRDGVLYSMYWLNVLVSSTVDRINH